MNMGCGRARLRGDEELLPLRVLEHAIPTGGREGDAGQFVLLFDQLQYLHELWSLPIGFSHSSDASTG